VYLPSTVAGAARVLESGSIGPVPLTAFAVTDGLRAWYRDDDLESLEYAAMLQAARASLRLLGADPECARLRVVFAADIPDAGVTIRDDLDLGVVRLAETVPMRSIAAIHMDEVGAERVVALAAEAIDAADLGEERAQATVDDAEGFELCWYATQELPDLIRSLGR